MSEAAVSTSRPAAAALQCGLALDTSTERMSLLLFDGDRRWTHTGEGGAQASATLIAAVQALLRSAGLRWSSLQTVAYGRGPGAFTGLRTACAAAQGFAFAHGLPVLPLDTLEAVAEDACPEAAPGTELWVAMDARMGEVYAARYRRESPGWTPLDAPALYAVDALAARWHAAPPGIVAGSAVQPFADRLPFGGARTLPAAWPSPAALAPVARAAWARGDAVPAERAAPLYLRDKVALTTAERLAAKATAVTSEG